MPPIAATRGTILALVASGGSAFVLLAVHAPGLSLGPSGASAFFWFLLAVGAVRGMKLPRRLLLMWTVGGIVAITLNPGAFKEWGIAAFTVLLLLQAVALSAEEYLE